MLNLVHPTFKIIYWQKCKQNQLTIHRKKRRPNILLYIFYFPINIQDGIKLVYEDTNKIKYLYKQRLHLAVILYLDSTISIKSPKTISCNNQILKCLIQIFGTDHTYLICQVFLISSCHGIIIIEGIT